MEETQCACIVQFNTFRYFVPARYFRLSFNLTEKMKNSSDLMPRETLNSFPKLFKQVIFPSAVY